MVPHLQQHASKRALRVGITTTKPARPRPGSRHDHHRDHHRRPPRRRRRPGIPEIDLYRDIHKGIRGELFAATLQAGSSDASDRAARLALTGRIDGLVHLLHSHAEHEDVHIQGAIEVHVPASAERIVADHAALDARIAAIHDQSASLAELCGPAARSAADGLYLDLASFVSAYLQHQDLEERVAMPALATAIGPLAVLEIHGAIIGSIPPQEMAESLSVMLPAMNVDDRTELLGGMRAEAPAEVFAGVWGLAGSVLTPADLAAVATRLDIPA